MASFNGLYRTLKYPYSDPSDYFRNDEERDYLRFYPDGTVLRANVVGSELDKKVARWFGKKDKTTARGLYKLRGEQITFTTKDTLGAKIEVPCVGLCRGEYMILATPSKVDSYFFISMTHLA